MIAQDAQIKILIVGAGLGGLSAAVSCALAGHAVTVLESAKELAEIGAGLQITPNAARLLQEWQLPDSFWASGAEPKLLAVHSYKGEILALENSYADNMRAKYGAPFIDMHRVDLQKALYDRAIDLGVRVHLNQRVQSIDIENTVVKTVAGAEFSADLIAAADGLWSKCRECLMGSQDVPKPTGDLAYRIVLTLDQVKDEDLRTWIKNAEVHFWIGPGAHAVGYSMRGSTMYNIVLLVPDSLPPGVARQAGSIDEMRELFVGWDPVLTRFINYVDSIDKWKLMHRDELPRWVNESSNIVLLGDSCHPMLPYLAQGANSSIEDGGTLGALLGKIKSKAEVPAALAMYEKLRKSRGETIVKETFKQRHDFHMQNGAEQEARDALFRSQLGKTVEGAFPSRWTCPVVQPWLYGYDATKEVDKAVAAEPFTAKA